MSTRFRGVEDQIHKLGALGAWLCCVLMIGLGVSPAAVAQTTVTYIHTDALGSVVAESDANGNVIKRYDYEPYGAVVGGQVTDGPGYTGHVSDSATGLSYMQQRYMDPELGMFLSVDPVTAHDAPVDQFNRYRYANGNPYKFKDPDGQIVETVWDVANIAMGASSAYSNFSQGNIGAGVVDSVGVAIDTVAAAVPFVPGGAGASIKAVRIADKAMDSARRGEQGASAAADGRKVWTATNDGVILPPGKDMDLVPTSAPNPRNPGWVQVHGSHPHAGDPRAHAHGPDPSSGKRIDTPLAESMRKGDAGLKDGSLRHRENRQDRGGP
ncbi:RHS repeat-associated core domain-containing protein [Stenotrophomonas sp. 57]|uniref:RHS repeat domain-containing protein n=1 Tax=Stenotrophomonas sp. 57 TaxID=3051119 RepID=UPI00256F31EE|nr:RHS repeat-associated core domain-containing protein [Stenotrophomonas sp. 57]